MSRKPDFLIVGMAKCGTSSLAQYLLQHPEIFICEKKEPRFLTSIAGKFPKGGPKDDQVRSWYVETWDEYLRLFKEAQEKRVGEASADTLYFYQDTIPVIKEFLGDPEIIIILRDPVKRAFSAYSHLVRDQREVLSFEAALDAEEKRKEEGWELIYHYKSASKYYDCVKAFKDNFTNVKVVLTDDLRKTPQDTTRSLFEFLGIQKNLDINTTVDYNVSGIPKNQLLHNSLQEETWLRKVVRPLARAIFPSKEARSSAVAWLSSKNIDKMTLPAYLKEDLYNHFKEDILKTEELTGLDLSAWKKFN